MSHQDKDDLRTPLAQLKELLEPIRSVSVEGTKRHGNAVLDLTGVMVIALLTFGWNRQQTLGDRFGDAKEAARRSMGSVLLAGSFAVDGSQFAVPRTKDNLAAFAAASRKAKSSYKKSSDLAKAKTTQIAVSLCLHLGTGFPAFWNLGGSADSERGLLLNMLDRLPTNARLVMDAYYFGFDFWNQLIDHGVTFVVRAGKNIDLLGQLSLHGKVKCRGDLVLDWPQNAIDAGHAPIVLSLMTVMVGRKKMFLLTNELTLSEQQIADLYARRWGVEVFFRTVKQSYERCKLLSRTPENAKQEIQWTLLGVWIAMTEAARSVPPGRRLSPVRVMRAFEKLVLAVSRMSAQKLSFQEELSRSVIADESSRRSAKNSKSYPRKKRKRQTGEPTIAPISDELQRLANEKLS